MKVAFISTNNQVPWGGSEELWSKAAIELRTRGYQVAASVAEWHPRPSQIQHMIDTGIYIYHHIRSDSLLKRISRKLTKLIASNATLAWYPDYGRILKSFHPDLVVISQGSFGQALQAIVACNASGIPYITLTQLVGKYHAVSDKMALEIHYGLNHALSNVFLCSANIKLASRLIGAPIPNPSLARNPCKRLSRGLSIPFPPTEKTLVLACVASLSIVHKGQDNILEILSLPKWRDRDIHVNFYGQGPNVQILQRLAQEWHLHNVYFRGYVDSLEAIWSECSALILASHMEAVPIVLTEAMLCRRPAIAPMIGTAGELIQDFKTGFLAKSSNIHHLEEALEKAWVNRCYLQQMGENAYQLANELLPEAPQADFCDFLVGKASEYGIS